MMSKVDLHIHTTASDGSDSPQQLVEAAKKAGLATFSITDHDSMEGAKEVLYNPPSGIRYIPGIELSAEVHGNLCHIVGYGYRPESKELQRAIGEVREKRLWKTNRRMEILKEKYGIAFTNEEQEFIHRQSSPGRPHLGEVLVARGLVSSVSEAFDKYLDGPPFHLLPGSARIPGKMAVESIQMAGGIAGWAHPLGGEGERHLTATEFENRLHLLLAAGVQALECYYSKYTLEEVSFLVEQAEKHGLLISGGSDYHGTIKRGIALGMLNEEKEPVEPEQLTILKYL